MFRVYMGPVVIQHSYGLIYLFAHNIIIEIMFDVILTKKILATWSEIFLVLSHQGLAIGDGVVVAATFTYWLISI